MHFKASQSANQSTIYQSTLLRPILFSIKVRMRAKISLVQLRQDGPRQTTIVFLSLKIYCIVLANSADPDVFQNIFYVIINVKNTNISSLFDYG